MSRRRRDITVVIIGRVKSVNFVKRHLRVRPVTDHPERFVGMSQILLETPNGALRPFNVDNVQLSGGQVLMTLSDGHGPDELEFAKNAKVVVDETDRYILDEDEYYIDDLIDMEVVDTAGRRLGRLCAVYRTGANDVYEVRDSGNREILIPALKERILNVDTTNRLLTVDLEGLLDSTDAN